MEASYCYTHGKELEFLCEICGESIPPMCSVCTFEHNQARHFKGNIQLRDLVMKKLEQFNAYITYSQGEDAKLKAKLEQMRDEFVKKDRAEGELDHKLETLKDFMKTRQIQAAHKSALILRVYEKATQMIRFYQAKIVHCIQRPQEMITSAETMLGEHKYWTALEEAKKVELPEIGIDYSLLAETSSKLAKEVAEFEQQIAVLDTSLFDPQTKMMELAG